jgi:hypothetical protein
MSHTGRFAPGKETQSPLYRRLGGRHFIENWVGPRASLHRCQK